MSRTEAKPLTKESGSSMMAVLMGMAAVGLIVTQLNNVIDRRMDSYDRNRVETDLLVARSFAVKASCDQTLARAVKDGINCADSAEKEIFLVTGANQLTPPLYEKSKKIARLSYLSMKVVCKSNQVKFLFSRLEKNGEMRTDRSVGLKGEWTNLFSGVYTNAQPFKGFPCT